MKLIFWICTFGFALVLGFVVFCYYQKERRELRKSPKSKENQAGLAGKDQRTDPEGVESPGWSDENLSVIERILLPAGERLCMLLWLTQNNARWDKKSLKKERVKNESFQKKSFQKKSFQKKSFQKGSFGKASGLTGSRGIYYHMAGEEQGRIAFERFQSRRLSAMLGALLLALLLVMAILLPAAFSEGPSLLPYILERSETGSAGQTFPARLVLLDGTTAGSADVHIQVPSKDMKPEEKRSMIRQALQTIRKAYDGIRIDRSLNLPSSVQLVKLSYRSLSPEAIRSDGSLVIGPQTQEIPITLEVEGKIDEIKESAEITFYLMAYEDLSPDRKAELMAEQIASGSFLNEEQLVLPDQDPLGRSIVYYTEQPQVWGVLGLLVLFPLLIYLLEENRVRTIWKERSRQSLMHLPDFTGELSILLGAGMSLSIAFSRMGEEYRQRQKRDGKTIVLYEELCRLTRQLGQGDSIKEALTEFADRLQLMQIRNLCALLLQSEKRGNDQLLERLDEFSKEAWEERKKQVRELSEVADTKLTFPLMLMLIAIILMVLAPSLISMSGWG